MLGSVSAEGCRTLSAEGCRTLSAEGRAVLGSVSAEGWDVFGASFQVSLLVSVLDVSRSVVSDSW